MDTGYDIIRLLTLVILLVVTPSAWTSGYHQTVFTSDTKDKMIQSEGFPGPYPADVNITWHWKTTSGLWAVVFFDFVLDKDSVRDWLEIDDGDRHLRYTNATPPLKDLITAGPNLTIRFISDSKTDLQSQGFRVLVMFGHTDNELHLMIHEARKLEEQKKENNKEGSIDNVLVICIAILALLVVTFIVVVVFIVYRRRHKSNGFDLGTSPRIRRDSGISHTRNGSHRQEVRDNDDNHIHQQQHHQQHSQQQQQHQQPPRRTSRSNSQQSRQLRHQTSVDSIALEQCSARGPRPSVQRSNSNTSQMNWILRAETTMGLKTADRRSKPNIYTDTPEETPPRKNSAHNNHSSSSSSSPNSPGVTVPYVDVMSPIPDQPSDNSQQNNDYDNFESVFNPEKSLDVTSDDSLDNVYTNTSFPPAYSHDLRENKNTDKKENFSSLQKSTPSTPNTSQNDGNDMYFNVHLSNSQKDIRSHDAVGNQGENEIYANIAIGLVGKQKTSPQSASNDSLSFTGSNFSLNRIVLSVKQETGNGRGGGASGASAACGQSSTIYDVPPPDSGSLKDTGSRDLYINLNDRTSRSRPTEDQTPKASMDTTSQSPDNNANDKGEVTPIATTVIPAATNIQTSTSPLYDTPKSTSRI